MKITKLYSDYDEYYDEKLYSTGDEDLDELLERAFCEGYEYAQREFGIMDNAKPITNISRIEKNAAKVVNRTGRTAEDVLKSNAFKGSKKLATPFVMPSGVNRKLKAAKLEGALKGITKNPKNLGIAAAGATLLGGAAIAHGIKRAKRKGWEDAKLGVQRTAKY